MDVVLIGVLLSLAIALALIGVFAMISRWARARRSPIFTSSEADRRETQTVSYDRERRRD